RVEHNSDRLNVKFHNNVSFASITGTEDTRTWGNYVVNWAYRAQLNTNNGGGSERSESYLGFYNAIGASYVVTDNLTADLQIANQRGLFTLNWEHGDRVSITNRLGLYAGITLSIVESERVNATLLGGVSVTINSFSYDQPVVVDPKTDNAGYVLFGIPLGIRIQF
ncbi:MAG: hypothetical protein FWC97_10905, partial [Treponema sp.]|nr:hypothetical protein [Treponema sp.]